MIIKTPEDKHYSKGYEILYNKQKKATFIHPPGLGSQQGIFSNIDSVISRLIERYQSSENESDLLKLAKDWERLSVSCENTNSDDLIQWFGKAKNKLFSRNEDSEQKMMYYLNDVTNYVCESQRLHELAKKLVSYFSHYPNQEIVSMIREMMKEKDKSELDAIKGEIDNSQRAHQQENINQLKNDLAKLYQDLQILPQANYHVKKILEHCKEVGSLVEDATSMYKDVKYKDTKNKIEDIIKKDIFKSDKFVIDYQNIISEICMVKKYNISGIIMHVHSTLDCCFSCAPDLAQESVRTGGFVGYLKSVVQKFQGSMDSPFFRLVFSCGHIREDKKRFDDITFKRVAPNILDKQYIYYQHFLQPSSEKDEVVEAHVSPSQGIIGDKGDSD